MVGILIIAHGTLGESLIQCAEHVLGARPSDVLSLGVAGGADPEQLLQQARVLIDQLDQGAGVLVLTDMCGGTPANVAASAAVAGRVEAVAGVNLPMFVRALTYRSQSLEAVCEKAMSGGREGVGVLGKMGVNAQVCLERRRATG